MRRVVVEAKVQLILDIEEGVEVSEVMHEIGVYSDSDETYTASMEVLDYEVKDSR